MKKILVITLLSLFLISLCACTPPDNNIQFEEPDREIFFLSVDTPRFNRLEVKDDVSVLQEESVTQLRYATPTKVEGAVAPSSETTLTVNGTSYTAPFEGVYRYPNAAFDVSALQAYGETVIYRQGALEIEYFSNGTLKAFLNISTAALSASGPVTQDQAVQTAKAALQEIYGTIAEKYVLQNVYHDPDSTQDKAYWVVFGRTIEGISVKTDDQIMVTISMNGEILSINTYAFGMFAPLEQDPALWNAMIDATKQDVKALAGEFEVKEDQMLVLCSDGRYYLKSLIKCFEGAVSSEDDSFVGNGEFTFDSVFMNVN